MKNHSDFCSDTFSVLIREVVEKRLSLYELKEDGQSPPKPEDGLGGPGGVRDSLVDYAFQDHGASPAQRPLPDRDSPPRAPHDGRSVEGVSSQEGRPMEEEDEQTGRNS